MNQTRSMELLHQVIDHVSATQNTQKTIHELLLIGFTPEELIHDFDFDRQDVQTAVNNQSDESF